MAKVFITGSTDGIGRAAAQSLLDAGHEVVLHARSAERAASMGDLASRAAGIAVGDLRSADQTRTRSTRSGAWTRSSTTREGSRSSTPEGHAGVLAVNTLAPYMLTALIERLRRLVYLSSGLHRGGEGSLGEIDWTKRRDPANRKQAAGRGAGVRRRATLAGRAQQSVDPGWVRTRMGGPGAPVDIETGQGNQIWPPVSDDPAAIVSGGYWHHMRQQDPASEAADPEFQDQLISKLGELTGVVLPET